MAFERPETLKQILTSHNAHYILSGKVHQGDTMMYQRLLEILRMVDGDVVLRQRVHYIQDYDEEVGRPWTSGGVRVPAPALRISGRNLLAPMPLYGSVAVRIMVGRWVYRLALDWESEARPAIQGGWSEFAVASH